MTMVTASALWALLAASPQLALVTRAATRAPDDTVAIVLREITRGLAHEGLEAVPVAARCDEAAKCLATIAKDQGFAAALGVTVIKGRRDLAVDVEVVDPNARRIAAETFIVPTRGEPFPPDAAEFFHLLKRVLTPLPEDAPRVVQLAPVPAPAPELAQAPPHRPLLKVTVVTTVATGAIGIGLLIAGLVTKGQLDRELRKSSITISRDEANARASLANGLGTGSATALTVCGAAGVTSALLWLVPTSAEED